MPPEDVSINEEDDFTYIGEMLESLAVLHNKSVESVQAMFEKVNCELDVLKGILGGRISADV